MGVGPINHVRQISQQIFPLMVIQLLQLLPQLLTKPVAIEVTYFNGQLSKVGPSQSWSYSMMSQFYPTKPTNTLCRPNVITDLL